MPNIEKRESGSQDRRRAKIVCTLGPATASQERITQLVEAGMDIAASPVEWRAGEQVRITVEDVAGTHDRVSTTYKGLAEDARPGDRLLVDGGRVGLRVIGGWPALTWSARSSRAAGGFMRQARIALGGVVVKKRHWPGR